MKQKGESRCSVLVVVQSLSSIWLFCDLMEYSMLGFPVFYYHPKFAQTRPLSWWCHPTISSSVNPFSSCLLPFPSIRVFSNESALPIRWPKYWSFSFNISPSNEHSGLISFRMDWLDLLAVQGTLKSLLQHHSSKASILWCSAFFIVQLTSMHDHRKNHSLDCCCCCC